MAPLFFIMNIALSLLVVTAVFAFLSNGALFGLQFPAQAPGFIALMVILMVISLITLPIRAARRASYRAAGFSYADRSALSLLWLGLVAAGAAFAYLAIPEVHYIINNLPDILNGVFG